MVPMSQLLVPLLVSSVIVFLVSSAIHMLSPWHKGDYPAMHNEAAVMDALRPLAIPPGDYFFPRATSRAEMGSPEFAERLKRGPVVLMTVMPNGMMSMARNLTGWFIYIVVVTGVAAHVAAVGLRPQSHSPYIFHEVALVSFVGYALALWQMSIWYRRAWSTTIKATVDAAIYAAITGAVFVWWWPRWIA